MKLRTFKKAIHRVGYYKYREPRCLGEIYGREEDDGHFVYYTCHKLSARYCLDTGELVYVIKRKK